MKDTNKTAVKILKNALVSTLIGALICFEMCMLVVGSGIFEMLLPIIIMALFVILYAVMRKTGIMTKKRWLCILIFVLAVAAATACLRIFC